MTIEEILKSDEKFRYQMLGRMQADCEYYLGYGYRSPYSLWALDEKKHIEYMKRIWESFREECKPLWLSWQDILNYEREMRL